MTYSKDISIWCDADDCEKWKKTRAKTVKKAVSDLRARGWTSPKWDEHYCPSCSENTGTDQEDDD